MNHPILRYGIALAIVLVGVAAGALLIAYSEADDAPGGILLGILLIGGALLLGARAARQRV